MAGLLRAYESTVKCGIIVIPRTFYGAAREAIIRALVGKSPHSMLEHSAEIETFTGKNRNI